MAQRLPIQYIQFYTDGSSAKKLEVAAPHKKVVAEPPKAKPAPKKWKRIYVDPVAIFGVTVAICMLVCMFVGVTQLRKAQDDLREMELYVAYLQQENAIQKEKYAASYNLEDVERTALALGMVPVEQAEHVTIDVTVPAEEPEATLWETIGTFLTGLFA